MSATYFTARVLCHSQVEYYALECTCFTHENANSILVMLINCNLIISDYHIIAMILLDTCLMGINGIFIGFCSLKVLNLTGTETTTDLVTQITDKCMNMVRTEREVKLS